MNKKLTIRKFPLEYKLTILADVPVPQGDLSTFPSPKIVTFFAVALGFIGLYEISVRSPLEIYMKSYDAYL